MTTSLEARLAKLEAARAARPRCSALERCVRIASIVSAFTHDAGTKKGRRRLRIVELFNRAIGRAEQAGFIIK